MSDISNIERVDNLSSTKRTLLVLKEMQARLDVIERERTEPIAIIGIGCRLPGGANSPEAFWQLLQEGRDAITEVPPERWNLQDYYDPDPEAPGKMSTRWGSFLQQVEYFDPAFFGISPREALQMDPQQRLVLEVAWEALERAGQTAENLSGSRTGVFVGATTTDYAQLLKRQGVEHLDAYYATGNTLNALAGRLSYVLGLQGPSMVVDTACSSSLVSVHLACQSLRLQECDMALAGGVNLILTPDGTITASHAKMLAADGRCKTFDARADGYVRGEGCGMIVLKRLSQAQTDGDPILALIRGSAVNQDGQSSGFTVPNGPAQQRVIRQALAQVEPAQVDYIEAHGTGTALGDPIEISALGAVFGAARSPKLPLLIGSVKTNLGHLEAAAGITGLLKVVLALQHEQIPPHLHLHELNPRIDLAAIPAQIVSEHHDWSRGIRTRLAGVSAFGVSGTNAHIVLEEAPLPQSTHRDQLPATPEAALLLPLSTRSHTALLELARTYVPFLQQLPESNISLADLCYTASQRRSHHTHRLALVGHSPQELVERLQGFINNQPRYVGLEGYVSPGPLPQLVFVFPGQGSQWVGMGRQLLTQEAVFRQHIELCEQVFAPYVDWSLQAVLTQDTAAERLQEIDVIQPVLFAFQVSLAALWRSWGIEPDAVVGHSMGEIAAAQIAGILSLQEAARIICHRSRLLRSIRGQGAMALVELSLEQAQAALGAQADQVAVAVSNSSRSTVLSGVPAALEAVCQRLEQQGVFWRKVNVDVASHSPQVDPLLADLLEALTGIDPATGDIPFYSTVQARRCEGPELDAAYWVRNLREPVRFATVVQQLLVQGPVTFLEISPHPILLPAIEQELDHFDYKGTVIASLKQEKEERVTLLEAVGALSVLGYTLNWSKLNPFANQCIPLPIYPWQRQRYWVKLTEQRHDDSNLSVRSNFSAASSRHPFLGQRLRTALKEIVFETAFSAESPAYLNDHRIRGTIEAPVVVPGSSHTSMALSAARTVYGTDNCILEEVFFLDALVLAEKETRAMQVIIHPQEIGKATFQIFSTSGNTPEDHEQWLLHATGKMRTELKNSSARGAVAFSSHEIQMRCLEEIDGAAFYQDFLEVGYHLGESFCWMAHIWRGDGEALCLMRLARIADESNNYEIAPGLMDSCFQLLSLSVAPQRVTAFFADDDVYVPVSIDQVKLYQRPSGQLWAHAYRREGDTTHREVVGGDIRLYDQEGHLHAEIIGLRVKQVSRQVLLRLVENNVNDWLYDLAWQPKALPALEHQLLMQPGCWLILSDRIGIGEYLARSLREQGERCIVLFPGSSSTQLAQDQWEIDSQHPEDIGSLLQKMQDETKTMLRGIVHLWSLDPLLSNTPITTFAMMEAQNKVCRSALAIVQALTGSRWCENTRLWLLTRGVQVVRDGDITQALAVAAAPLWGLGRTIANEYPELHCTLIDLDSVEPENWLDDLLVELQGADREQQLALRGHERYCARLVRSTARMVQPQAHATAAEQPVRLNISERGILDNLSMQPTTRRLAGPHEVEIRVRATGLNFRDVLNALGMYPGDAGAFGGECAGTIVAVGNLVSNFQIGDDIIAIFAPEGSFSSFVTVTTDFVVPMPSHLSFAEAATIPMTFLTAYYGLYYLAHMTAGDRVLIHAAAGGVGFAAVQLAQQAGAQVFATASVEKHTFLRDAGVLYVANSRSLEFAHDLRQQSEGQSVDIILNSLAGDFIAESLTLLSAGGRFIEIGKNDIWSASQFAQVRPDISYAIFDLVRIAQEQPSLIGSMLSTLMEMLQAGSIRPLPCKAFPQQEIVSAFRYMAQAKQIGKVVVTYQDAPRRVDDPLFLAQNSYLITGGLSGLGLVTARWMAEHGARHLALLGRRAPTDEVQAELHALEHMGVQVVVFQADVTQEEQLTSVFASMKQVLPALRGIIHSAGVLDDGILQQQTWERFTHVLAPKIAGAWHLHTLTQDMQLDFFIMFSSAASLLGSAGQSNHAAANAFLDALAQHRRSRQLPAISILWGGWSEIGAAARPDVTGRISLQGMGSIAPWQGLQVMELVVSQSVPLPIPADAGKSTRTLLNRSSDFALGVLPINWSQYLAQLVPGSEPLLFSELLQEARLRLQTQQEQPAQQPALLQRLATTPANEHYYIVLEHVREQVLKTLGGDEALLLDGQRPLRELGLDSLMSIELRNILRITTGMPLPATLLFDYPSVEAIAGHLTRELSVAPPPPGASEPESSEEAVLEEIEQLSDEDVDSLLEAMAAKIFKSQYTEDIRE